MKSSNYHNSVFNIIKGQNLVHGFKLIWFYNPKSHKVYPSPDHTKDFPDAEFTVGFLQNIKCLLGYKSQILTFSWKKSFTL
jgi:hypothetical protein